MLVDIGQVYAYNLNRKTFLSLSPTAILAFMWPLTYLTLQFFYADQRHVMCIFDLERGAEAREASRVPSRRKYGNIRFVQCQFLLD